MKTKMLEQLIAAKQALIEKTTDAAELAKLTAELGDLREQLGEAKAEEKADAATKAAEREALKKTVPANPVTGVQVVGAPPLYKGFRLKAEVDYALRGLGGYANLPKGILRRMQANPERAEGVLKTLADLWEDRLVGGPASPRVKAAMQEGTDSEGGYLTPTEQHAELLAYVRETSIALQDCRVVDMNSDSATVPAELTKVTAALTAEEVAATEAEPTFSVVTLTAKRIDAYSIVSNELLEDALLLPGGVLALLLEQFTEAMGQYIDSTVFLGAGSPMSGVFKSTAAGYSVVFSSGSTHFSALLESNLRSVITKLQPSRRGNAKFYMANSILWPYVYGLKDGNSRPLFVQNISDAGPGTVWGYPVREGNDSVMPSTSAAATGLIFFGDLRKMVILGRRLGSIRVAVDPYYLMPNYQTRVGFFSRWAFAQALSGAGARIATAAS